MELDMLPTSKEITKTIRKLKSNKAAGIDGICPEIWKHSGPVLLFKALQISCLLLETVKTIQRLQRLFFFSNGITNFVGYQMLEPYLQKDSSGIFNTLLSG